MNKPIENKLMPTMLSCDVFTIDNRLTFKLFLSLSVSLPTDHSDNWCRYCIPTSFPTFLHLKGMYPSGWYFMNATYRR